MHKCCKREIVKELPREVFPIQCGGKNCEHRIVYGLINEDCRQVIILDEEIIISTTTD